MRDLCAELGKDIELEMHGAETELDRQVLELVKDPLTHLVRNCADHGIETPAERLAAGKPAKGHDPSQRLPPGRPHHDRDRRRRPRPRYRAHQGRRRSSRGWPAKPKMAGKSDAEVCNFIFEPGFSTAQEVTSISGRGVGMDVVRGNIEQIGGTVDLKSVAGAGTRFTIKIPLTLAIVSALIVEAGRRSLRHSAARRRSNSSAPAAAASIASSRSRTRRSCGCATSCCRWSISRGLHRSTRATATDGFIVVTQVGSQMFGIVVDAVFHTEEIVVKPMSRKLRHIPLFSGNTILGDGSVIMIIEPNGIAQLVGNVAQSARDAAAKRRAARRPADDDFGSSMLVFRAGSPQPRAVPLSLVTRLEEIDVRKIEIPTAASWCNIAVS